MTTTQPWERQPGETNKAYENFRAYLELGPTRSQRAVARKLGKSIATVSKQSARDGWPERAQAWDMEQDREYDAERRQKAREAARRHAGIANLMQNRVVQRLQELDPSELRPADLIRWLQVTAEIERQALGIAQVLDVTVKGPDDGPIRVEHLTDDEALAELARETSEVRHLLEGSTS